MSLATLPDFLLEDDDLDSDDDEYQGAVDYLLPALKIPLGDWINDSACRNTKTVNFFADDCEHEELARAQSVCQNCVVRLECLNFAIESDERWGVWGGLTRRQRSKLRRGKLALTDTCSS